MSHSQSDRNLLFGILALQMDFIGRDALIAAMNNWVLDKSRSLGQVLVAQGALDADTRALLETLVQKHLELFDNDAGRSLAALRPLDAAQAELQEIADSDLQASMAYLLPTPRSGEASPATG